MTSAFLRRYGLVVSLVVTGLLLRSWNLDGLGQANGAERRHLTDENRAIWAVAVSSSCVVYHADAPLPKRVSGSARSAPGS